MCVELARVWCSCAGCREQGAGSRELAPHMAGWPAASHKPPVHAPSIAVHARISKSARDSSKPREAGYTSAISESSQLGGRRNGALALAVPSPLRAPAASLADLRVILAARTSSVIGYAHST